MSRERAGHRSSRPRIVILGGGFAGAYCAQALDRESRGLDLEIVLLDRNNYFVFHPLLVEAGTGSLQPRHVVVSIRSFLQTSRFRMAEVTGVETSRQAVRYRIAGEAEERTLPYDHLVIALGSITRMPPVPGLAEHGWGMKNLADAVGLRDHAIRVLERADATDDPEAKRSLLHFVVVGGNYTGVEVAGEFFVFLREAARHYSNVRARECRVTLVEIADRILPALDRDLSDYATRKLRQRGIDVLLETSVESVEATRVHLRGGKLLDAATVIWCAGIAAPPELGRFGLPLDQRGYLLCEPDLRVRGFEDVWGIGDAAVNPAPDGRPYPATAQHAVQEGAFLAKNLVRRLRGAGTEPFVYESRGALAPLGCRTGVAKISGVKLSGFAAWFLWRTVYLLKMPGWSRRLRVALDWTADLVFPRDYVQLGIHRASDTSRPGHRESSGSVDVPTDRGSEARGV